jgi:methionine-rich copper-binding protein CopC
LFTTLGVLVLAVLAPAAAAEAHVNVVSSQPTDGAVVSTAPTTVSVRFSERVDPKFAELTLSARGGAAKVLSDPRQGATDRDLVADLPLLDKGVYSVAYRVRDPIDLHLTAGSIVFGVGTSEAVRGSARPAPSTCWRARPSASPWPCSSARSRSRSSSRRAPASQDGRWRSPRSVPRGRARSCCSSPRRSRSRSKPPTSARRG